MKPKRKMVGNEANEVGCHHNKHEQSTNHISLIKTGLDVMQSHPLRRTRFGQYQASSAALG